MNKPTWHKIFSDLWSNLWRSTLVVASITVGLFAMGVIACMYSVLTTDMQNGYAAIQPANLFYTTSIIEQDMVDGIQSVQGVKWAEGAERVDRRVYAGEGEWIETSILVADYTKTTLNQIHLVEGKWPPAEGEIVFDRSKLDDINRKLGDDITLELPSGKTRTLHLVGVVQDLTIGAAGTASSGYFLASLQGYVALESQDWIEAGNDGQMNTLFVQVEGDSEDPQILEAVAERVTDQLESAGHSVVTVERRSSFNHPNKNLVDAIIGVLVILGLLIMFLSGFLITNTLQALLDQQMGQIGIMKTVGARRMQVGSLYVKFILILSLLALMLSVPLAEYASFFILYILSDILNVIISAPRLIGWVVILQSILAVIVPQMAAFMPIYQGSALSVQEALSGLRQSKPKSRSQLDRLISQIRRISRPMRISLRNVFRRKGRLILTLITLTLGGAVFIATFNVRVSMLEYVDQITQYFQADVNVDLDRPYRVALIKNALADVPGVGQVEGWAGVRAEILLEDDSAGERVQVVGPPANSQLITPILIEGRWIVEDDENAIVLNELFQTRFPDLKLGDTLRLRINSKETEWVVVGIFQMAGKTSGYLAYTNYPYLAKLTGQTNQATSFRINADHPLDPESQERLARQIEATLNARGVQIKSVDTGANLTQTATDGFNALIAFLLFMAVLTAMVGSISLAGTMSMNVMERTREIGVMRSIGADNRTLMEMVIVEGMLIGLLSWLFASIVAFPISKVMADGISLSLFSAQSTFGFTPIGFVLWLGIVIVLSVLASVMPARTAASLTIREVLAYE